MWAALPECLSKVNSVKLTVNNFTVKQTAGIVKETSRSAAS
jgi:hypothetical protein